MTIGFFKKLAFLLFSIAMLGGVFIAQDRKTNNAEINETPSVSVVRDVADRVEEKSQSTIF